MHPGAGNYDKTIVNALMHYDKESLSNIGDELRPGIVHRIDKKYIWFSCDCKKQ
jgi:23S rRNA pseudouridine1911/1915/1917 synthase